MAIGSSAGAGPVSSGIEFGMAAIFQAWFLSVKFYQKNIPWNIDFSLKLFDINSSDAFNQRV
jgi:hypothetical protein